MMLKSTANNYIKNIIVSFMMRLHLTNLTSASLHCYNLSMLVHLYVFVRIVRLCTQIYIQRYGRYINDGDAHTAHCTNIIIIC